MKRPPRRFALLVYVGGAAAAGLWASDPQATQVRRPARLNMVAGELLFGTVNPNGAIASKRIWADQVRRIRGFQFAAKMAIVRSAGQLLRARKEQFDSVRGLPARYRRQVDAAGAGSERMAGHPGLTAGKGCQ